MLHIRCVQKVSEHFRASDADFDTKLLFVAFSSDCWVTAANAKLQQLILKCSKMIIKECKRQKVTVKFWYKHDKIYDIWGGIWGELYESHEVL